MNIAISEDSKFILLTNENLQVGDKVFPALHTYHNNGKVYVLDVMINKKDKTMVEACTGWPNDPHIVTEFYIENGITFIRTNKGYSPAYKYFKVMNQE